jgi:membrane fusion protein (multidrug efflux system)
MELSMPALFLKLRNKPSFSHILMTCAVTSLGLVACGKKEEVAPPGAGMVMPVSVISVKSTSVPITAEAVAQTEGEKEV